jgi:uncharacterized membrane protein YecN with MAPEG domain
LVSNPASETESVSRPSEGARIAKFRAVASVGAAWQGPPSQQEGKKIMILPVTLTFVGVAALVNLWLAIRCGQARTAEKVSIGDGGSEAVIRRMRAHSNYIENTPFVLIMIAAIELANSPGAAPTWLWAVAALYFFGRVAHGLGMDGGALGKGRSVGTIITMLTLLGLGAYCISIPYTSEGQIQPATTLDMSVSEAVPAT